MVYIVWFRFANNGKIVLTVPVHNILRIDYKTYLFGAIKYIDFVTVDGSKRRVRVKNYSDFSLVHESYKDLVGLYNKYNDNCMPKYEVKNNNESKSDKEIKAETKI